MFKMFKQLDHTLVITFFALASTGLILMFSSSIDFSDNRYSTPFFHLKRQLIFWGLSCAGIVFILNVRLEIWQRYSWLFLVMGFVLLVLVAIPGVGKEVNGSRRWIGLGGFNLQSSEFAKLGVLIYLAGYLVRRQQEVRSSFMGMFKPMIVLGMMIVLLLLEPDFGSVVVLSVAALTMIYLSGVRITHFFGLLIACGAIGVVTIQSSAYRMKRLSCFLDPWEQPFDCGYQLTQSLIAIGRGEWFGTGLGNSVQKLFYLPESHTDFVFAILAEELGLFGGFVVIMLFALLVFKIMVIARKAELNNKFFGAYLTYGIGTLLAIQVFINLGVNTGLLPTKGLTLPFFSYGGSSLIVSSALIAFVLRVDYESRIKGGRVKKPNRRILPKRILQGLSYE